MKTLDVGCGWDFEGEVNLDMFLYDRGPPSRKEEREIYNKNKRTLARHIPNFVCADCNNLPFREKTFETVFCNHVLEHKGVDHIRAIKEMMRITTKQIIIRVPSQLCHNRDDPLHDNIFSRDAFHKILRQFKRIVRFHRYKWIDVLTPKTPKNALQRFVQHTKLFNYRINNPLHKIPCPIPTEIQVIVHLDA